MNLERRITRLISLAARQQMTAFNRHLAQYRIGGGSYVLLVRIVENPGITQSELSLELSLDKATVGKALRQLAQAELIVRRPDPADRRRIVMEVTDTGLASYREIMAISAVYRSAMFSDIPAEEQQQLEKMLRKVTENQRTFLVSERTENA